MRPYLLQDLVRVRQHREEQASEAVARAVRLLKEAQAALTEAQQNLADYTVWRVQEERRKLDSVMRRVLKLGELSDVRQEIALLREREFEFVDKVTQAEAAVVKAEAHLDECRQRHAQAVRELEKLLEHRALWQRERALEQERAEDAELEDFSSPRSALTAA
jgi:type III secretion protein O